MDDAMMTDDEIEIRPEETTWAPPEGVTRHAGVPIEPGTDFFADPPAEIGDVISADSTLRAGKKPWRHASRVVICGLIAWAGYMIADAIGAAARRGDDAWWVVIAITAVIVPIAWFATRFAHTCSFVGRLGVARYKCVGSRAKLKPPDIFLFRDASELRTSQTRMYHNGVYTGTSYTYTWTDDAGAKVFKLSGTYRGEKKPPKPKDAFHLAVMSEEAWSQYLLSLALPRVEAGEPIAFNLKHGDRLELGPGFLDIRQKGTTTRLTPGEIGDFAIQDGVVKIKRIDAQEGWFSSTGVYKFGYDAMANFRLFGMLYGRLLSGGGAAS